MRRNQLLLGFALVMATMSIQGVQLYKRWRPMQSATGLPDGAIRKVPKGNLVEVDLAGLPLKGSPNADVIVVEFSDYECPFCARHAATVQPEIDKEFVATGKVRVAFLNNPLPFHTNARLLATAALCAGQQGRYWEMHDALFRATPTQRADLLSVAPIANVSVRAFALCLETSPQPAEQIERDIAKAKELQLSFTPAFGIGRSNGQGRMNIEMLVMGAQSIEVFRVAIGNVFASKSS